MHKPHQGLPRLRTSYPGSSSSRGSSSRWPATWTVMLAVCGLLLIAGLAELSGYLGASSSSNDGSKVKAKEYFSSTRDFEPLAAAVAALQNKAARTAAAAAAAGAASQAQQQQQQQEQKRLGAESLSGSVSNMARTLREDAAAAGSSSNSTATGVAFFDVNAEIKSTADAMARKSNVHGHVAKSGVTDIRAWMGNYSDARLDSFISWRVNRTRAGGAGPATADSYTCPAADHPPLPFPGCHVFVNHKYKYIYIRSPKAASTSIVNVLGECNNKATRGYNSTSCMVLHFYWNSTELATANLTKMWQDYFVFGFVRNPWRRAYSLYKYLHSNGCMHDDKLRDPNCHVPWPEFCADPWSAAEQLHDKGCIKRSKSYLYFHMEDQFHCMRTADGNWAVDYIGRVDDPNDDWAEVVNTLNAKRSPEFPEIPIAPLEQKNARAGNIRDPYQKPGADQCFNAVSRWYACDVEKFGFAAIQQPGV